MGYQSVLAVKHETKLCTNPEDLTFKTLHRGRSEKIKLVHSCQKCALKTRAVSDPVSASDIRII